jgi:hypothetical protein
MTISRRQMLAITAAAGISGQASGQAARHIEKFDPSLDNIISTSEPVRELARLVWVAHWGRSKDQCGGRKADSSYSAIFKPANE